MFNGRKMEEKREGDIAIGYVIYQRLYFCLRRCGGRCVCGCGCVFEGVTNMSSVCCDFISLYILL